MLLLLTTISHFSRMSSERFCDELYIHMYMQTDYVNGYTMFERTLHKRNQFCHCFSRLLIERGMRRTESNMEILSIFSFRVKTSIYSNECLLPVSSFYAPRIFYRARFSVFYLRTNLFCLCQSFKVAK